ncbi:glycosyltransferase [Ornithinimicrobium ciconiae]|uniref:Glycosyltransferase n=1 Tax=Ornithinimicrobium ciconiae TaxID=2594265 RepID=A0A516G6H3_9MICO|nr:glycosyltransferase [Ornithinimicrobium ciconiae]QDO86980.1 glycosyltransferase [Ornithinimicrobium ciconiae]
MTPRVSAADLQVTFLATVLTPRRGMENALVRLASALAERHQVEILVLHDPGPVTVPGVTVTCLDAGTERHTRAALRRRLRAGASGEILVLTGVWAGAQLLLAAPWALRSAVAWEHSLTPTRLATGRRFRLRAELVARSYRRARAVVAVSPVVASTLCDQWSVATVVLPNLLDLPELSPGATRHAARADDPPDSSAPVRLLALGQARAVKNFDVLIRSLPLLTMDWRLRMVGGGPLEPELQAQARQLGVDDRIEWVGDVADPGPLLADSDVLVHPASSETFGYVLFEAAEHWLPVVACDAPVMNTLVPDTVPGLLTQADPAHLAAAVEEAARRYAGPGAAAADEFRAADALRRRAYSARATIAAWEEVLHE